MTPEVLWRHMVCADPRGPGLLSSSLWLSPEDHRTCSVEPPETVQNIFPEQSGGGVGITLEEGNKRHKCLLCTRDLEHGFDWLRKTSP